MHQIRWLRPKPVGGAYSAPPNSVAAFKEPTSNGRNMGKGRAGIRELKGSEGRKRGEKRGGGGTEERRGPRI